MRSLCVFVVALLTACSSPDFESTFGSYSVEDEGWRPGEPGEVVTVCCGTIQYCYSGANLVCESHTVACGEYDDCEYTRQCPEDSPLSIVIECL